MKRIIMITLLALSATVMVFAQGIEDRRNPGNQGNGNRPPRAAPVQTSVTGNLTIANGMIAIKDGDTTYVIPGLMRYAGFIDSLKDGARVTIEGAVVSRQADATIKRLIPYKLTIGNKEYELRDPSAENRMYQDRQRPRQPRDGNNGNFRRQGPNCPCQWQQRQFKQRDNRR